MRLYQEWYLRITRRFVSRAPVPHMPIVSYQPRGYVERGPVDMTFSVNDIAYSISETDNITSFEEAIARNALLENAIAQIRQTIDRRIHDYHLIWEQHVADDDDDIGGADIEGDVGDIGGAGVGDDVDGADVGGGDGGTDVDAGGGSSGADAEGGGGGAEAEAGGGGAEAGGEGGSAEGGGGGDVGADVGGVELVGREDPTWKGRFLHVLYSRMRRRMRGMDPYSSSEVVSTPRRRRSARR